MIRHAQESGVQILAYCFMRNHVHLVLQPTTESGLSWMMMRLNSEYGQAMQFRMKVSGHFWQARFKASVMDEAYLWTVLRYVELNPVRAGAVTSADQWPWSSAGAHLGTTDWPEWLEREPFVSRYTAGEWRTALLTGVSQSTKAQLWRALRQNRPLAAQDLIQKWEAESGLHLVPRKRGRPSKKESGQLAVAAR